VLGFRTSQSPAIVVTWKEALDGAELACANARRLADDALFLHGQGRYETAFPISLLAWEETNKAGLLLKQHVQQEDISRSRFDKIFRDHEKKLRAYSEYENALHAPSTTLARKAPMWDAATIQAVKQLQLEKLRYGLYVDFIEKDRRWTSPSDFRETLAHVDPKWQKMVTDQHWMSEYYTWQSILTCARIEDRIKQLRSRTSTQP
jgi:AbiV family abortive infection protein